MAIDPVNATAVLRQGNQVPDFASAGKYRESLGSIQERGQRMQMNDFNLKQDQYNLDQQKAEQEAAKQSQAEYEGLLMKVQEGKGDDRDSAMLEMYGKFGPQAKQLDEYIVSLDERDRQELARKNATRGDFFYQTLEAHKKNPKFAQKLYRDTKMKLPADYVEDMPEEFDPVFAEQSMIEAGIMDNRLQAEDQGARKFQQDMQQLEREHELLTARETQKQQGRESEAKLKARLYGADKRGTFGKKDGAKFLKDSYDELDMDGDTRAAILETASRIYGNGEDRDYETSFFEALRLHGRNVPEVEMEEQQTTMNDPLGIL